MCTVFSTFNVPDGKADEVINIYKNRSHSVDQAEGFVDFFLLQNDKKAGELTVQLQMIQFMNGNPVKIMGIKPKHARQLHTLQVDWPVYYETSLKAVLQKMEVTD
ncbi:hypothetical protein J2S09_005171 [Bacillus fengqiuensis]|nr:hypothetical protein [Bacillus fengqiuensis]